MTDSVLPLAAPARAGRRWRVSNTVWLVAPGVLFLAVFFLFPTLQMMSVSLFDRSSGALSIGAYSKFVSSTVYFRVLTTTFGIAAQVTLLCLLFGYPLAYWLAQKSGRSQRLLLMLILLPFWTSPLVLNFSWLVLLGRNGAVAMLMHAVSLEGGDLLFSRATVIFAMTHTMLPLAVITMLPVMNAIDRRLTLAAMTLGATGAEAFWRVYFQLSMRGVATAGLLVFVSALGFFITPALVGGRQDTMIGQLIIQQINSLQNWQLGSALAVVLIVASLATIFVYDRVFGLSGISGGAGNRSADSRLRRLGIGITAVLGSASATIAEACRRRIKGLSGSALLSAYCTIALCVLLFPIVGFVLMAFTRASFLSFPPDGFSTKWFEAYATSPVWMSATVRSFGIGIAAATLTLAIATMAAFGLARSQSRFAGLAFLLFMAPMVVPPIVIAIALFYLFVHLHLIATDTAIVIGHTVISMPIVFVVLLATFKTHDWRLDQVASTLGAGRFQVLRRVTFPLVKGGLLVALVTGFLTSFEELTVAIFIGGGLVTTLPKQMWDNILLQVDPTIAAASVAVLLIVTLLFVLVEWLQVRRT